MRVVTQVLLELLCASVLVGCWTSWVVVLLRKWGVLGWLQAHGNDFVSELAGCSYCQNWWLAWLTVAVVVLLTGEWVLLAVPFFSTTIGRLLVG